MGFDIDYLIETEFNMLKDENITLLLVLAYRVGGVPEFRRQFNKLDWSGCNKETLRLYQYMQEVVTAQGRYY